ncbi:MAG: SHOCT domain-containing protein [Chloroflexota bacterium]|nr:SHOCT domain-containing protein [Chloroflexota bacterium]
MQQMLDQCAHMMGGMMNNGMMLVGTPIVLALVIGGTVLLVRLFRTRSGTRERTPLTILQERFARGELDIAEYQERRSMLVSQGEV